MDRIITVIAWIREVTAFGWIVVIIEAALGMLALDIYSDGNHLLGLLLAFLDWNIIYFDGLFDARYIRLT